MARRKPDVYAVRARRQLHLLEHHARAELLAAIDPQHRLPVDEQLHAVGRIEPQRVVARLRDLHRCFDHVHAAVSDWTAAHVHTAPLRLQVAARSHTAARPEIVARRERLPEVDWGCEIEAEQLARTKRSRCARLRDAAEARGQAFDLIQIAAPIRERDEHIDQRRTRRQCEARLLRQRLQAVAHALRKPDCQPVLTLDCVSGRLYQRQELGITGADRLLDRAQVGVERSGWLPVQIGEQRLCKEQLSRLRRERTRAVQGLGCALELAVLQEHLAEREIALRRGVTGPQVGAVLHVGQRERLRAECAGARGSRAHQEAKKERSHEAPLAKTMRWRSS
jgi:hypothetical protein